MSKKPGNLNNTPLADRMKGYESVTTNRLLMERTPVYARIDGRAFHTFCRGLTKPFDQEMVEVMQETCKRLIEETNASIGYVQSDEISLGWSEPAKCPFETRLFKLESCLAAMATSFFTLAGMQKSDAFKQRIIKFCPHFDCRVCQMPTMDELANMFLWRQLDCLKNSITLVALSKFSTNQILHKNGDQKIEMLKGVGIDYHRDIAEHLRYGSFFKRQLYHKYVTELNLPPKATPKFDGEDAGGKYVIRSCVDEIKFGSPLLEIQNKAGVLFAGEQVILRRPSENPDEEFNI